MKKLFVFAIFSLIAMGCSTQTRWAPKYRDIFLSNCIDAAAQYSGASNAGVYCSCMLEHIEKNIPKPTFENYNAYFRTEKARENTEKCLNKVGKTLNQ